MEVLLTAIVTWLSINFQLAPNYEHPRVEFVYADRMAQMRYGRLLAQRQPGITIETVRSETPNSGSEIHSFYDDANRTIYLPKGWIGASPAELSVLVHEMVHHLQNVGGSKFECPQAREKDAYVAQERWLGLFGRSLKQDFDLDQLTLRVRTKCMF
jgi:hypothetical protein